MIFRTAIQNPWYEWNPALIYELRINARQLVVRIPGLLAHQRFHGRYTADEPCILAWEVAVKALFARKHKTAFIVLQFDAYPSRRDRYRRGWGFCRGSRLFEQWPLADGLHHRLSLMMHELRAALGDVPLIMHVEDWSARWAMLADYTPTYWLMDNPFIARDEAADLWAKKLSRPGILRHSRLSRLGGWPSWRMHMRPKDLIAAHLPLVGRHGIWDYRKMPVKKMKPIWELVCK